MTEFNVIVSSPLLAHNLYELSNRTEDCEGLIFGSYRCKRRSNVDDVQDRVDVVEHELIIKKFYITGVRNTFYDQIYRTNVLKLNKLITDVDDGGRLELLGWFTFNRVASTEMLMTSSEICRRMYSSKQILSEIIYRKIDFPWGGPLFLNVYERTQTDDINLSIGETKYQMYYHNSTSTSGRTDRIMKKLKLKILNVGDTSHADYASIDVQNCEGFSILSQLSTSVSSDLVDRIETNVTALSSQSTKSVSDVVNSIQMSELRLNSTNGVNYLTAPTSVDGEIQSDFSVYQSPCGSWEIVNDAADVTSTSTTTFEVRGQKREKAGDQSCSSSGNNSDELETVNNAALIAGGGGAGHLPTPLMSNVHFVKKSRGPTGDAIGMTSSNANEKRPKGRARTMVSPS